MLSWRMKEERFECLKKSGRISLAKRKWSYRWKLLPSAPQLINPLVASSSTNDHSLATNAGTLLLDAETLATAALMFCSEPEDAITDIVYFYRNCQFQNTVFCFSLLFLVIYSPVMSILRIRLEEKIVKYELSTTHIRS